MNAKLLFQSSTITGLSLQNTVISAGHRDGRDLMKVTAKRDKYALKQDNLMQVLTNNIQYQPMREAKAASRRARR